MVSESRTRPAWWNTGGLPLLLALGMASGALYVLVYVVQRGLFLNGFPTSGTEPALRDVGMQRIGDAADKGRLVWQLAGYYVGTIGLFALYAALLRFCGQGRFDGRWAKRVAILCPVIFTLGLLWCPPTLSRDMYTYLAYGYIGALDGGNPYGQLASDVVGTDFGSQLLAAGWLPWHDVTLYGPLWTILEIALVRLTGDVTSAMLLLKGLIVACVLGAGALIWAILGRVRPADQLLGTLMFLWNPLIVLELAGDGHNDALVIVCVLGALLASVGGRTVGTVVGLALGTLVKYLPIIFLPAQLVYFARNRATYPRLIVQLLIGGATSLGLTYLLYRSLWIGTATYQAVPEGSQRVVTGSLSGLGIWVLSQGIPATWAAWIVAIALDGIFAVYILAASWRARDLDSLLRVCAGSAILAVLIASPFYWPWYATLPIALLALTPRGTLRPMVITLALGARLVAPMAVLYENHFTPWWLGASATIIVAILIPLALFLALGGGMWRNLFSGRDVARRWYNVPKTHVDNGTIQARVYASTEQR